MLLQPFCLLKWTSLRSYPNSNCFFCGNVISISKLFFIKFHPSYVTIRVCIKLFLRWLIFWWGPLVWSVIYDSIDTSPIPDYLTIKHQNSIVISVMLFIELVVPHPILHTSYTSLPFEWDLSFLVGLRGHLRQEEFHKNSIAVAKF